MYPEYWPKCWSALNHVTQNPRGEASGQVRVELGSLTSSERGRLIYRCPCKSTFERVPGFQVPEAREWVIVHSAHVPQQESV